jgi:hypothetical protein
MRLDFLSAAEFMAALKDWRMHASARSRQVFGWLNLLAQKNHSGTKIGH